MSLTIHKCLHPQCRKEFRNPIKRNGYHLSWFCPQCRLESHTHTAQLISKIVGVAPQGAKVYQAR